MRQLTCFTMLMALLFSVGCAVFAVRPPTPAVYMDVNGLEPPAPSERFYVLVFGSESTPKVPRHTHTWATAVRVVDRDSGATPLIERHTISWMPATLKIRPFQFQPEPGVNLELCRTIELMLEDGQHVAQWGPYECRPALYHRLLTQKAFLDSGQVAYQCIDDFGASSRRGTACDCIHAITDMDPEFDRRHYRLSRFGQAASEYIVSQFIDRDTLLTPSQTHPWLNQALGLDRYPIEHFQ